MDFNKAKDYILDRLRNELRQSLYYHGFHHTIDVLEAASWLADSEGLTADEKLLVETAALYHDSGFVEQYAMHEATSCEIARSVLPGFGYTETEIEQICGMIMATKIPQAPKNKLEEILCDADLDYLGREDYPGIAETLYKEFTVHDIIAGEKAWNALQISFFRSHTYFTDTAKKLRDPQKQRWLLMLLEQSKTFE